MDTWLRNVVPSRVLPCRAMQCIAVQCNAMQCHAVLYRAVQCNAVRCSAIQCAAVQYNVVQCDAVQCNTVQCSAVQCHCWSYQERWKTFVYWKLHRTVLPNSGSVLTYWTKPGPWCQLVTPLLKENRTIRPSQLWLTHLRNSKFESQSTRIIRCEFA